jgi:ABC-type branched-subunit amino acid transport system ATPase component/MFS family permease
MTATRDRDELGDGAGGSVPRVEPVVPEAVPRQPPKTGNPITRAWRRFRADVRSFGQLRRTPYGLGPVLIFAFITFFQELDSRAFYVASPDIVRETGVNIGSIIDIATIAAVVVACTNILVGWWADRHHRVPLFAIGTGLAGVFGMLRAGSHTTVTLGAPVVLDEVSTATGDVPSYSLLADYYPPEARGRTFSFLGTMNRVARLSAVLAVGIFLTAWGWRTTFVIVGVPIVLMSVLAAVRLREPTRGYFERRAAGADEDVSRTEDEPQSLGEGWRATFAVRTLRRTFFAFIVFGMGFEIVTLLFPFYLADRYGLSALQRGYILIPPILVGIYAGVLSGALLDRLSTRNPGRILTVYGLFLITGGIGVLGYAFHPPLVVLILATCVQYFGFSLTGPAVNTIYSQVLPPAIRTQGLQVTGLSVIPGAILGLQIGRLVFANYGYQSVFFYGAPFYILAGLIAMTAGGFFDSDRRNALAAAVASEEYRRAKLAGNKKVLVARGVDVEFDGVQVLFGVDFDVEEGECIALLGTNGAGKSTLLRAISGSREASGGGIVFEGRDITHMPPHEIASRGVVSMPGGRGVFPGLSVRDNLFLGNWLNEDPASVRAGMNEVFEIFPLLRERADAPAGSLSGGEQQMLSLAQAFLMRPKLLMIDELTLGLSPAMVGELLDVVREIHRRGVTIIVVEQSVNIALNIAERAIFMEKGEVKFVGRTADLLGRPDILRAVYVKGTGALTDGAPAGARRGEREQRRLELDESRPVLEVAHVTKRYGGVVAVDDVSLDLRDGEVLGIIGPNGSGKTTLFDVISGFQPADGGLVRLAGVDITDLSPDARVRAGLVRRFQDARLFPSLTVFETLLIALENRLEVKSTLLNAFALPQARRAERRLRRRADRLIDLLGIEAYRDKFVKELSTGLRRIVDLACVLATEPKVLLLDEPSSGIAQAEAEGLGPLLRRVRFETGCSILLIEHDMPLVSAVADELLALDQGHVLVRGTPDVVLNDVKVIESYLGGSEAAIRRSGRLS